MGLEGFCCGWKVSRLDAVWLPGNSHEKSEPGRLTALGLSRTMLMLQRWLTDVLITLEPFGTKGGTRRVLLPRRVSFVECPRARG